MVITCLLVFPRLIYLSVLVRMQFETMSFDSIHRLQITSAAMRA